ncbi:nucleotidyltransferase family protein [Catenovulum sp. SX2]|uniref:nucleotidyltransferase family protein n=1 Tax=Catenovulum sp. SX2 TaxID=3398614 RepID=UPI003F86017A
MRKLPADLFITLYNNPETAIELTEEQWQVFIWAARSQQLLARYEYIFNQNGLLAKLPKFAQNHLKNAQLLAQKQYLQVYYEAEQLTQAYGFSSNYKVFLKGAAYTLAGLEAGKGRIYSDIDLLIDKKSLAAAEQYLCISGWMSEEITQYDADYYRKWTHEIPPLQHSTRGTVLDLHHNLIPPVSGRAPKIEHFFAEIVPTASGYSVLSPAAMTLHSIVHLFFNDDIKHGYRDLLDLDLLIKEHHCDSFWTKLIDLAELTGFTHELKLCVRYLTKILHTPIPAEIKQRLLIKDSIKQKLLDFIFFRALKVHHPFVENDLYATAESLATIRGHWLKMPIHILIYHLSSKFIRNIVEFMFGKAFFMSEDPEQKKY